MYSLFVTDFYNCANCSFTDKWLFKFEEAPFNVVDGYFLLFIKNCVIVDCILFCYFVDTEIKLFDFGPPFYICLAWSDFLFCSYSSSNFIELSVFIFIFGTGYYDILISYSAKALSCVGLFYISSISFSDF